MNICALARRYGVVAAGILVLAASSAGQAQTPAITAKGLIESTVSGFRFPDGTVQTSAAAAGATYKRTVIISPVAGNSLASGTVLLNALASITTASATDRWLLKLEPGIYDLGTNALTMKSYVDIEGSGDTSTLIMSARSGVDFTTLSSVVIGAGSSELRAVMVRNVGGASLASVAVYAAGVRGFNLRDVYLRSRASIAVGLFLNDATVDAFHITISAGEAADNSADGVVVNGGAILSIANSSITADARGSGASTFGIEVNSGTVELDNSSVVSRNASDFSYGLRVSLGTTTVTNSLIKVELTGRRYAVATSQNDLARILIYNSRVVAGAVFTSSNVLALSRAAGSTLRVSGSLVDSASGGSPTCILSFSDTAATTCPAPN
jgi:hypothetical protein